MLAYLSNPTSARAISHLFASSSTSLCGADQRAVTGLLHAARFLSQTSDPAAASPTATPSAAGTAQVTAQGSPASPIPLLNRHQDDVLEASPLDTDAAQSAEPGTSDTPTPAQPPALLSLDLLREHVPPHVLHDLRPPTQPYQLAPKLAQRPTPTPALYTPWTPTRALQRRSRLSRRMGFLMEVLEREQAERVDAARPVPDFRAGDILEVRVMVPEVERKVALYRGVCIARYDKGIRSSFKIYNVFPDCGGVVQHLPLYMPDLLGIKVVGRVPATQERLYYLLERESSDYTFQQGVTFLK